MDNLIAAVVQDVEAGMEVNVKNHTHVLIFNTRICAENVTNIFYPTRKTAFADFSCGSSNINVLGMEVNVNTAFFIIIMLVMMLIMFISLYYLSIKINKLLTRFNINISKRLTTLGVLIVCIIAFVTHSAFLGFIAYSIMLFIVFDILKGILKLFEKDNKVSNVCRKIYGDGMLVVILALVITIYGAYNARHLYVKEYKVTINKEMKEDLNIIMISDIHAGTSVNEHQLDIMKEEINKLKPDIVCLTGDIFDERSSDKIIGYVCDTLGKLETKYGVYYISGNHDVDMSDKFEDGFKKNNIHILDEEVILINDSFYLAGRRDRMAENRKTINDLLEGVDESYPVILLDHRPDDIDAIKKSNVDLQLSGHTHNGQIFPLNFVVGLFNDVSYGHKKYNNYNVIVSSGYGTWGFPVRTGSSAEIVKVLLQGRK